MEKIAQSPYTLIEEPEVEVMNVHTDDLLFEIMTKSRTVEQLIAIYNQKGEEMNNFQSSVFLTRFMKLVK